MDDPHAKGTAAKRSISAVVSASHTGDFDAPLSHLTLATGFIETMHPGSFRDAVDLRVGEMILHGEIAFVCDTPMGWVVRFDPTPELELLAAQCAQGAPPVQAEAANIMPDADDLWGEKTPTFPGPPLLAPPDALADLLAGLDETEAR